MSAQPSPGSSSRSQLAAARVAAEARYRTRRRTTLVALLLVLVVGIGAAVQAGRGSSPDGTTPDHLTGGVGIRVGAADAPVTVTVYEDFQCPACRDFESRVGPTLDAWRAGGRVAVDYRPMAFLDRTSSTDYSTRALNAAAAVVDTAPEAFPAFHRLLFENQPEEGTAGLPDDRLVELARVAGAGDIAAAVRDRTFQGWTVRATEAASKAGINGTPTVLVDGRPLAELSVAALTAAVDAAG